MLGGFQHTQYFVLAKDQVFLIVDLDLRAGILSEKNALARFHVQRDHFTLVGLLAMSDGNYFSFLGFLLGRDGNDDPTFDGLFLFYSLDQNSIMKRSKRHLPVSFQ